MREKRNMVAIKAACKRHEEVPKSVLYLILRDLPSDGPPHQKNHFLSRIPLLSCCSITRQSSTLQHIANISSTFYHRHRPWIVIYLHNNLSNTRRNRFRRSPRSHGHCHILLYYSEEEQKGNVFFQARTAETQHQRAECRVTQVKNTVIGACAHSAWCMTWR